VVEMSSTGRKKFLRSFDSPDFVFEFRGVSLHDIDEVFLHLLNVFAFDEARCFAGGFVVEERNVFEQHPAAHCRDGLSFQRSPKLGKDPGLPNGTASDHETGGIGFTKVGKTGGDVDDISVRNDGAGELLDGVADHLWVDRALVTFFDSASVNGEEVDGVLFKNTEESVEFIGSMKTNPSFYGEGKIAAGLAQNAEEVVDVVGIPEESATGVLAVNDGSGAAEIEIDPGDGVFFELVHGADEFVGVLANHLRDEGATGGVLGDGAEDVGIEMGVDVDAEVLGDVNIGSSKGCDDPEKGEVRHVLHGREKKSRTVVGQHGVIKGKAGGCESAKYLGNAGQLIFLGLNFMPRFL
jgi:uncharacterized protein YciU (UPF0263 family)